MAEFNETPQGVTIKDDKGVRRIVEPEELRPQELQLLEIEAKIRAADFQKQMLEYQQNQGKKHLKIVMDDRSAYDAFIRNKEIAEKMKVEKQKAEEAKKPEEKKE